MTDRKLYSYEACPFAQRTRIALHEKGLDFDLTEIDLSEGKPDWFAEISPYGKVPLLLDGKTRFYESAIINEYLDEQYPEPPLMPDAPEDRAQARIWMHYCEAYFLGALFGLRAAKDDEKKLADAKAKVAERLTFIETEGLAKLSRGGPFFLGDQFTLVDIQYAPFFERMSVYEALWGLAIPADLKRLNAWTAALRKRPSVRQTARDADYHLDRMKRMLKVA